MEKYVDEGFRKPGKRTSGKTKADDRRRKLLAQIHIPVNAGFITDEERRDLIFARYGARSSKELSDQQLAELATSFRAKGWLDGKIPGGTGAALDDERPTKKQWRRLAALCKNIGWEKGLEAPQLRKLVRKLCTVPGAATGGAKIDDVRFVTRKGMLALHLALENMIDRNRRKGEAESPDPVSIN
jgi:hypothetical protein